MHIGHSKSLSHHPPPTMLRKRKAVTRDVSELSDVGSDVELRDGLLEGIFSQSEDSEEESAEEDGSEEVDDEVIEDLSGSEGDQIPSEWDEAAGDYQGGVPKKGNGKTSDEKSLAITHAAEDEDKPNYTVTTDANGGVRYVYDEINPVYDSDDSDAPTTGNTIGNIPLSFYDSYPHIGYDINGKRIMRPAKGEALDALLDSIDIPKGWTGLTDPTTGKPLNLSREELEILRRIQTNELPEEGYDPYPVR